MTLDTRSRAGTMPEPEPEARQTAEPLSLAAPNHFCIGKPEGRAAVLTLHLLASISRVPDPAATRLQFYAERAKVALHGRLTAFELATDLSRAQAARVELRHADLSVLVAMLPDRVWLKAKCVNVPVNGRRADAEHDGDRLDAEAFAVEFRNAETARRDFGIARAATVRARARAEAAAAASHVARVWNEPHATAFALTCNRRCCHSGDRTCRGGRIRARSL